MQDQATKLRRLVSRLASVEGGHTRPRRIVLTGAKGGVGTTTLAINLAIALRKHAEQILLIDANPIRGDVAQICRLRGSGDGTNSSDYDLEGVLQSRRDWQQAMLTGPGGIQVVPRFGLNSLGTALGSGTAFHSGHQIGHQLVRRLETLQRGIDFVVIDAGSCPLVAEALWPAADQAMVVTTDDHIAVTDAYAMIKSLHRHHAIGDLYCVINRYVDEPHALDVATRLRDSCKRFLQLALTAPRPVPIDTQIPTSLANGRMLTCAAPNAPAALAIADMAEHLAAACGSSTDVKQPRLNSLLVA